MMHRPVGLLLLVCLLAALLCSCDTPPAPASVEAPNLPLPTLEEQAPSGENWVPYHIEDWLKSENMQRHDQDGSSPEVSDTLVVREYRIDGGSRVLTGRSERFPVSDGDSRVLETAEGDTLAFVFTVESQRRYDEYFDTMWLGLVRRVTLLGEAEVTAEAIPSYDLPDGVQDGDKSFCPGGDTGRVLARAREGSSYAYEFALEYQYTATYP